MPSPTPQTPRPLPGPGRVWPLPLRDLITPSAADSVWRGLWILLLFGVAVVLGIQYVEPDKRVLQILAAAAIFAVAWKLDTLSGLCMLLLALPYPRGTIYGSTNVAFILLLMLIWLLRITQIKQAPPRSTPLDMPIVGLLIAYAVSFYNIAKPQYLQPALMNTFILLVSLALYYMIVNNVHTPADLARLINFQAISCAMVCAMSVWELNHPGQVLIPGWISFPETGGETFNTRNVRVGGPFFDYELLGEYCALHLFLATFLFARARSASRRWLYGGLWLLVFFVLFATLTRGAIVALAVGVVYLTWLARRRINFVKLVAATALLVATVTAMNFYVANFTRSGDMLSRLGGTKFVGLIPESRAGVWDMTLGRWLQNPIIGIGPYYWHEKGLSFWVWPHNVYIYYLVIVGAVGLFFFLWILWRLWRVSRPGTDDLFGTDYVASFRIIAHAMLFVFMVDEFKIDYLRNSIYQIQVWVFFAMIVAAHRVSQRQLEAARRPATSPPLRAA